MLEPIGFAGAPIFTNKERRRAGSRNPFRGISRDVQRTLATTRQGKQLTALVDAHRGELLTLLATNGDLRRATVAALRPLTATLDKVASGALRDAAAPLRKLTVSAPG